MLRFIALPHQKKLLYSRSVLHTDRRVGADVNVHCIASSEDVVTLKMLLRSRCRYVEDVVTMKMLLLSGCCYSRCYYVKDAVTFKMLLC